MAGYAIRHVWMSLDQAFEQASSVRRAGTITPDYQALVTAAYDRWLSIDPT